MQVCNKRKATTILNKDYNDMLYYIPSTYIFKKDGSVFLSRDNRIYENNGRMIFISEYTIKKFVITEDIVYILYENDYFCSYNIEDNHRLMSVMKVNDINEYFYLKKNGNLYTHNNNCIHSTNVKKISDRYWLDELGRLFSFHNKEEYIRDDILDFESDGETIVAISCSPMCDKKILIFDGDGKNNKAWLEMSHDFEDYNLYIYKNYFLLYKNYNCILCDIDGKSETRDKEQKLKNNIVSINRNVLLLDNDEIISLDDIAMMSIENLDI